MSEPRLLFVTLNYVDCPENRVNRGSTVVVPQLSDFELNKKYQTPEMTDFLLKKTVRRDIPRTEQMALDTVQKLPYCFWKPVVVSVQTSSLR